MEVAENLAVVGDMAIVMVVAVVVVVCTTSTLCISPQQPIKKCARYNVKTVLH